MERKDTKLCGHSDPEEFRRRGFSLIELLIVLAISGFLAIGLWALMQSQNKTYRLQDTSAEMQQNLRAAVDRISKDLLAAGQGPQWQLKTADGQTTNWYATPWNPYSCAANSNRIDLIVSTSGIGPTLKNPGATLGATTLTLDNGLGVNFSAGTYISIGGAECAKVTKVAGDVLTIDTNPTGTTHTLQNSYPSESYISPLQWVTYQVAANVLTVDVHDGNGAKPIANDISALALTTPDADTTVLTLTITGSTPNGVTSTALNKIRMRNIPHV